MPRKKYGNAMFSMMHNFNKSIFFKTVFIALLSLNFNQAWSKTLVAEVDNRQIEMGDIISVRVIADFQTYSDAPDFDSVKDQFEVLGSQRSSNVQIINGQYSSTTEWLAQMTPKQIGELRIPSFQVEGARSSPIVINVSQAKAYGTQNKITFIEAEINKTSAYVQEEVIYTLRFFHLGRLADGNIRPPLFDDALVKQLKNQQTYQKKINGQIYEVFEWRYAFYPQHSGELIIEPQDFTGRLQLSGQLRSINDSSPKITLAVNPKPDTFPVNSGWLPATKVVLQESWQTANQHQNKLHVGDSLTRTLKLQVVGQIASQLPSLNFENQPGIQIYPDQAKTNEEIALDGYRSEKLFKMAIIPTQDGQLTLPEITLNWWNTKTNTLEKIILPAKTLDVWPSLNATVPLAQTPANPTDSAINTPAIAPEISAQTIDSNSFYTPIVLSLLFLIALAGWVWQWRQTRHLKRQIRTLSVTDKQQDLASNNSLAMHITPQFCETPQSSAVFYRALHQHLQNYSDWQKNAVLVEQISQLKAHLFKTPETPLPDAWQAALCEQLKVLIQKTADQKPKQTPQLQTLYPD